MRPGRRLTREMVLFGAVLLGAASCSVLYDLDQVQCEIPDDCAGFVRESGVREVKCVEGVCAYEYLTTSSSGGAGGTGGGSGGSSTNTTSPSTSGSGGGTPSSTSSTGGSAGGAGAPGCIENDECIDKLGNPAICRDEACIDLYTDECPIVLGTGNNHANLKSPRIPLIFGAYAGMGATIPENTAITANYAFAIGEVNDKTAGGYRVAGSPRPFVAVVCDVNGDIPASMQHLVKTLKVPAIVPTFNSRTLLEVFENEDYGPHKNNVFLMSPFDADSTLTNEDVDPNGLMWHLLGEAADRGLAYKPLVERAEAFLRAQHELASEEPIRVAMVVADTPYLKDIASVVTSTVRFNGMSLTDNERTNPPNLLRVNVESAEVNSDPDVSDAYTALRNMDPPPHLVLAITSSEFLYDGLLRDLENYWHATMSSPPPFYLLSPRISRNLARSRAQQFETPPFTGNPEFIPLRERILGVVAAGAVDTTLYDKYLSDFKAKYGQALEGVTLDGTENFYDAAYYTMYAIHGGKTITNITGRDVSRGMTRLVGGSIEHDVGWDDINDVIDVLRSTDLFITVNGTLGPPEFNGRGARTSLPGVYCIDLDPHGTNDEMAFYPDVLRYHADTELLIGDDPCSITGFMGDP
jgi:hypothetical protein